MNADSDRTVRNAKNVLRLELEMWFTKTSKECRGKISLINQENLAEVAAFFVTDPIIQNGFDTWREESLKCITSAFWELRAVVSPKKAQQHVCEVVKGVFKWATDETSPLKFKEWEERIDKAPFDDGWPQRHARDFDLVSPECKEPDADLADQLSLDFRTCFKKQLALLRGKARLRSANMPTKIEEVASTGNPTATNEAASQSTAEESNLEIPVTADHPSDSNVSAAAQQSLATLANSTGLEQMKRTGARESENQRLVDAFIAKVSEETGRKIIRKNISTVARYKSRTELWRFESGYRCTATARLNFDRVLSMTPKDFASELKKLSGKSLLSKLSFPVR